MDVDQGDTGNCPIDYASLEELQEDLDKVEAGKPFSPKHKTFADICAKGSLQTYPVLDFKLSFF